MIKTKEFVDIATSYLKENIKMNSSIGRNEKDLDEYLKKRGIKIERL